MRPPPPSAALLAAAQAGDRGAQDELLGAWAGAVLGWCRRLGGPRVNAEDAAQDVLLALLTRLGTLREPDDVGPWLWGATRRVLADHRKRAWLRRWVPGVFAEATDPSPAPDHRVGLSRLALRVQTALDAMPAAQREVFVLCDVEQHTDLEAAALVGLPLGTVKSRLRLARARFAAATADLTPFEAPRAAAAEAP